MDMVPQGCVPPSYLEREDMVEIQLCRPCDLRKDDGTPSPLLMFSQLFSTSGPRSRHANVFAMLRHAHYSLEHAIIFSF